MGRQVVEQITCDRCTRVEHRPVKKDQGDGKDVPDFVGAFLGEQIRFDDLCSPCQDIVNGHWEQIKKELTKSSPRRPKKT